MMEADRVDALSGKAAVLNAGASSRAIAWRTAIPPGGRAQDAPRADRGRPLSPHEGPGPRSASSISTAWLRLEGLDLTGDEESNRHRDVARRAADQTCVDLVVDTALGELGIVQTYGGSYRMRWSTSGEHGVKKGGLPLIPDSARLARSTSAHADHRSA